MSMLYDAGGNRIGAYQFAYDVTDRLAEQDRLRKTEEALRQAQKMEAVGQLTGGLAHDFNNLLAGISGAFQMIGVRLAQGRTRDVDKYVTAGQGAARRAASLTHRLLAFSRRQTLSPKPIVVNRLMTEFVELVPQVGRPVDRSRDDRGRRTVADTGRCQSAGKRAAEPVHQLARRDAERRQHHD